MRPSTDVFPEIESKASGRFDINFESPIKAGLFGKQISIVLEKPDLGRVNVGLKGMISSPLTIAEKEVTVSDEGKGVFTLRKRKGEERYRVIGVHPLNASFEKADIHKRDEESWEVRLKAPVNAFRKSLIRDSVQVSFERIGSSAKDAKLQKPQAVLLPVTIRFPQKMEVSPGIISCDSEGRAKLFVTGLSAPFERLSVEHSSTGQKVKVECLKEMKGSAILGLTVGQPWLEDPNDGVFVLRDSSAKKNECEFRMVRSAN